MNNKVRIIIDGDSRPAEQAVGRVKDSFSGLTGAVAHSLERVADDSEAIWQKTSRSMAHTFSSVFVDGVKGELNSFSGYLDMFLSSLSRSMETFLTDGMMHGGGGNGGMMDLFSGATDWVVSLFHGGGIAGSGAVSRRVPAMAFAGAEKYHTGGIAGFRPDEVPAILRRREEVLTTGDPRHRNNGGGGNAINITQNISLPMPSGNQEQDNAYLRSAAKAMKAEMKALFADELRRSRRPGGMLNGGAQL